MPLPKLPHGILTAEASYDAAASMTAPAAIPYRYDIQMNHSVNGILIVKASLLIAKVMLLP